MNQQTISKRLAQTLLLPAFLLAGGGTSFGMSIALEGQNKGDTVNWFAGNLQNWQELDFIPCRVHWIGAQGNNQTVELDFPHLSGTVPGFENLFSFTTSPNIVFTSPPVLTASPTSSTWFYTFTINILDNQDAYVYFFARLAAGAHLNVGSSLALSGKPSSMGNLQVHKPAPGPGTPDLMVLKTGPSTTRPGDFITYVLSYTNKTTGFNPATGVQLNDILPPQVTVNPTNIPAGGILVGNTIYWDLPNLPVGVGGQISFVVQVSPSAGFGISFTNTAQILSAENDLNYADNISTLVTTTVSCSPPSVAVDPLSATRCPGGSVTFTGTANGTGPLNYQWSKNGVVLSGATGSSYAIGPISAADAGSYVVVVTNMCGSVTSAPGVLVVSTNVSATGPTSLEKCPGDSATFSTTASGTGPFSYVWRKDGSLLPQTNSSFTISSVAATDAGLYSVEVTGPCGPTVTNAAALTVDQPVSVNRSPANLTNCAGTTATFTVNATGTGVSYQWYYAMQILSGQTGSSLVLSNITAGNAGLYTVVVSGLCGNSITNSASLTIPALPSISCAPNKSAEEGSSWSFDLPTANYPIVALGTTTNTAGHCGSTFDATRTWVTTDACGNSAQCSQTVSVVDTTAPVINCTSTNKTVEMGTAWTFDTPTATDNGGTNITITILSTVTNTTGHCGNTFDATRTWVATDACGNTAQCSQTVNVADTTAPVINCSSTNKTVEMGTAWTFDAPTATDNGGTNITITVLSTVTNTAGHCGNTFDATRTWVATDACGNSAQCSQTVNVADTTAPVINCSSTNKTVQLGSSWTFDSPTASDNGGTNITITILSTVTNISGHCGSTFDATRTWLATDACGNSAQCSQTANVVDTTAPVINCSSTNKTVELGAAWTFDAPTATDNSGTNIAITILGTVTNTTGHCGSTFDATRTWVATDACGNSAQCSQTVNVVDTTAPVINCSSTNKAVELGTSWTFDAPSATDNGGTNITITVLSTVTNTTGHCGSTFDATRTWVATDACGNTAQCSQTVNVLDTTAPVINCSSTNKTVEFGTAWTFDTPTATDNSSTKIVISILSTVTNTTGHCGNTFDATRTWVATDACGNSSQCSQTVNIVDTTAPVINCSSTNKTVQLGTAWTFDAPTATDNGGTNITITVLSTVTNTTGHCGNTFDATRTWVATDACGNSAQCSQTVNVLDTMAPVINCSSTNKTVQLGSAWVFDAPTATDNGGTNITVTVLSTVTNTAGHCGNTFDATRTWVATDACGNSAQCSQTVNVVDTTAPVINCSSTNKTVQIGTAWTFDAPTATDNGGTNITITILSTVTNTTGHCGNTFDATRTWVATDACGNSAQCSQTVNVVDTTAPVINCSNTNKTVQLGTAWTFDAPIATDNGGTNITITVLSTGTNTAGHCGNTFDATRTWVATDACGNSAQCSQTVNVVDTMAPIINCSSTNKTVQIGTAWRFDAPTATDNGGTNITIAVLSSVTNTTGHCGNTFDATRTWVATDACGNSAQCSQTVNVVDTTAPVINCSSTNKTVQLGTAWVFDAPTATDNGGTNITITILSTVTNTTGHCGSTFDATRTWVATDACGNSAQCSQTVNVVDTTAPIINCSNTNKTVQLGTAWTFDAPTATDNGGTNITITVLSTVTNTTGHCGSTLDATRTWVATDACGNTAQCSQTVNVVDTTAPVINCSNTNKTVQLGTAWTFDAPTATDNGGTNITITVLSTVTNTTGHCGNTFDATRTWVATDACGNSAQCSQTVNVVDTTAPVINCSNTNKTVQLGTAWTFDAPTATDNGGTNITIAILSTVTNTTGHCGNTFDATRTWIATDACGNSAQCSQTVNVVDTTAPVINCSNTNKTVQLGTAWTFDAPTATDNGGTNITITVLSTVTNTAGHCGNTFDATRTWVATDACGNTAQCSQTVNVVDTTAPVINCSNTNKTVQLGTAWTFDAPTATDNGGTNITITVLSTVTNTTGHCGNTFDATRTWVATDACGNSAQCSQTVNVVDTTAPVINCSNTNKTVQLGTAWTFDAPTATDNGGTNITITILSTVTNTTGHCGNTFDATRTWVATDACGNSAQCSQTVNVVDTTAPVINCSSTNKTVQLGAAWTFDAPTATDNGGTNITITVVSTVTNTTGHCGNTFDATRTWVATDACGNSAQCSQTVNVMDTTAPVINCSNTNKTVQLGTAWTFDAPTATDNSGTNITITILSTVTNTAGHCGSTFDATRTWVATDACGNSAQCSQTVNVVSTTAPVINCSSTNKTVQLGSAWTFDTPTATDTLGSNVTITVLSTITNTAGHCGNTFDATRTWVATDACGNSAQCSQTVNVVDTAAPVINCSNTNKTVQLGSAWTFDTPTATDNGGTNITITVLSTVTNFTGHCGSTFDATRTWVATDACGNSAQCSQTVNVADTTAPVINCSNTNKTVQLGSAWTFDTPTATDNGGTNITITVLNTVTNAGCGATFTATRTWVATDACGNSAQCSQTVAVIDTVAPTVSIITPTNGSVFVAPAQVTLLADADDGLGTIASVEFFSNGVSIGLVTNTGAYYLVLTNVPAGNYTFTARATDGCGNAATSAPVTISVTTSLPIVSGSIHLNFQTGFYEQTAHITNPTPETLPAVGVLIYNLPAGWRVQNQSFTTNGVPGVLYNQPLAPGASADVTIKYFLASSASTNASPTLVAMQMPPSSGANASGTPVSITRGLFLPDGTFLLNFNTVSNATYYVLYSADLVTWKTSPQPVTGNGFAAQWIDYGSPATDSAPKTQPRRFYRVIRLP